MPPTAPVAVTYYLEVLSSWCHWAEPAWLELRQRYSGRVAFDWKIALMNPDDFPTSRAQCDWFYRRSGTVTRSPYMLHSGWFAGPSANYHTPDLVAEAGRSLGVSDDRIRLALTLAALRHGQPVADLETAIAVAAPAGGLDPVALRAAATSPEIRARVEASTAEFHAHRITQRPAFVLTSAIGDKAVFSGLVKAAPLAAAIDAMLDDAAAYASHAAHHGAPPGS